jgi:hypothetical protein
MKKQLSERELIELQIQAYEFYAGLIDRAVESGAHEAHMPRWDEQRAVEYRQLAEQLRRRLAELEAADPAAADPAAADSPATAPVPTTTPAPTPVSAEPEPETAMVGEPGNTSE